MGAIQLKEGQASLPTQNPTDTFWHTDPSPVLRRRQSPLPATADVVIVGSGITATFAAWYLSKYEEYAKKRVVMLEAREACWGATGRNGGHCQPNVYGAPPHIAKFELETFWELDRLVGEHGIDCDWVVSEGVHALMTQDLVDDVAARLERLRKDAPELAGSARLVVNRGELVGLGIPGAKGAVVQKHAAALWPYKLVVFFLERLVGAAEGENKRGFSLQTGTPALGLQKLSGESASIAEEDEECKWVVHTPRGQIAAPKVLLCCNGYISHLVPEFTGLVVPVRGQMAALRPPPKQQQQIRCTYVFAGNGSSGIVKDDYLIQRPASGGELLFGGGRGYDPAQGVGVSDDGVVDEGVADYLRGELGKELDIGTHQPLDAMYEWTGIMGFSRDGHPWVGEARGALGGNEGGLWVCGGYTGHGMPVGARCAKAVVEMMVGIPTEGREVELPDEFWISNERVERAKQSNTYYISK